MGFTDGGNHRSGRGGRGRGRFGGRGNGQRSAGHSNSTTNQELKFTPQGYGKGPQASYSTVKDAVIKNIQKNFKNGQDVAKSIKQGKIIDLSGDLPTMTISTKPEDKGGATEQAGFNILYQEELQVYMERKDTLRTGMNKAYTLIYNNYCTRAMQARIEEHPDFEMKIEDNPIELLDAIKTLTHDTVCATYPLASITDAHTRFINAKQGENEFLLDYVKRFKKLRDVAKSQTGTNFLSEYVERHEEYINLSTAEEKKEYKKGAYDAWTAYLLMRGVDQAKYGSLMKNLREQFSLGKDQYPKTLVMATDVLSNHRLDQKYYNNKKKNAEKRKTNESKENEKLETSFQQKTIKCYCCGEDGHAVPKCPMKDKIPKEEWYVRGAMFNMQEEDDSTNASNGSNKDKKREDKDKNPKRKQSESRKDGDNFYS